MGVKGKGDYGCIYTRQHLEPLVSVTRVLVFESGVLVFQLIYNDPLTDRQIMVILSLLGRNWKVCKVKKIPKLGRKSRLRGGRYFGVICIEKNIGHLMYGRI